MNLTCIFFFYCQPSYIRVWASTKKSVSLILLVWHNYLWLSVTSLVQLKVHPERHGSCYSYVLLINPLALRVLFYLLFPIIIWIGNGFTFQWHKPEEEEKNYKKKVKRKRSIAFFFIIAFLPIIINSFHFWLSLLKAHDNVKKILDLIPFFPISQKYLN